MEAAHRISRLCEGWQARVQDSTPDDLAQFAQQFLRLLGWEEPAPVDIAPGKLGLAYVLRGDTDTPLLTQFVMTGLLDPPGTIAESGLDFCACTRTIVPGIRHSRIHYALITDFFRSYLYDVRNHELLLYADHPEMFNREVAPELTRAAVEQGSLEELRRAPRSQRARQLRRCCERWTETIAGMPGGSEPLAEMIVDRMLLLPCLAVRDVIERGDWSLRSLTRQLFDDAMVGDNADPGRRLTALFDDLWKTWGAQMFQPIPQATSMLEREDLSGPMLRDFALLSPDKFSFGTVLESFNYGDAAEKARVRLVPEPDPERELILAKLTAENVDDACIEIDLADEGYRAIFHWFDRMLEACRRIASGIGQAPPAAADGADGDLLEWSKREAAFPSAVRDSFAHIVEHGIKVLYTTPRQYRTARFLLYLYAVDRCRQAGERFHRFPDIERALVKRPSVSERGRRRPVWS